VERRLPFVKESSRPVPPSQPADEKGSKKKVLNAGRGICFHEREIFSRPSKSYSGVEEHVSPPRELPAVFYARNGQVLAKHQPQLSNAQERRGLEDLQVETAGRRNMNDYLLFANIGGPVLQRGEPTIGTPPSNPLWEGRGGSISSNKPDRKRVIRNSERCLGRGFVYRRGRKKEEVL